jgi:single-stranded-DNA-specific exonuclease
MDDIRERPLAIRPLPADIEISNWNGVDPVVGRIYAARGVVDAAELDYGLRGLLPISSLTGIDRAVDLILEHSDKRITIIGDFDADGATSTALVIRCCHEFGITNVDYLVPNRFKFGYGLTPEIVRVAAERSPDLIITVDNGVSSIEGVEEAHKLGMKVLITDHHLPGPRIPEADANVNPNLDGNTFGSPNLAGVGVAFYLMAALGKELESRGREGATKVPARYLDLVALGTVADVVRLDHNNRILVNQGLARIRAGRSVLGIAALFQQAGRSVTRAVSTDLGFVAGPRLNAAGRLEDMSVGIECLLTDDPEAAARIATMLDDINKERKSIEARMRQEAFAYVDTLEATNLPTCVCLFDKDWHQGVVGLIAARVRERCDRPVIAFAREDEGTLKGSARSIPGVHVRDLLAAVSSAEPGLITRFGGHAMAAGLTLPEQHFERFAKSAAESM